MQKINQLTNAALVVLVLLAPLVLAHGIAKQSAIEIERAGK